jgi:nitroreductase
MMDVIEAIHTRRAVRSYEVRAVERALIESIVADAAQAPPPFSGQVPWTFHVIQGAERIAGYGGQAMQHAREHQPGASWVARPGFKIFWDAPVLIIISGPAEDCARAGQNLMLSAHARGLGTCWVGSPLPWLRTPEVKAELGIAEHLVPGAALCLGYAAVIPEAAPRAAAPVVWVG